MMKTERHLQSGMSMIEVLVSVVILSLGLLGLARLQARALMMNQSSHYRSIAADLASDLADRIRANRSPFIASTDASPQPDLPPDFSLCPQNASKDSAPPCTTQTAGHQTYRVQEEMTEWNTALRSQLPNASYAWTNVAAGASTGFYRYTVTITWLDDRTTAANASYSVVIE